MERVIPSLDVKKMKVIVIEDGKSRGSIQFVAHLHLHLHMGEVISGNFASQEHYQHVEGSEVAVELSRRLHQRLPVLQILIQVVPAQFLVDLLQF